MHCILCSRSGETGVTRTRLSNSKVYASPTEYYWFGMLRETNVVDERMYFVYCIPHVAGGAYY